MDAIQHTAATCGALFCPNCLTLGGRVSTGADGSRRTATLATRDARGTTNHSPCIACSAVQNQRVVFPFRADSFRHVKRTRPRPGTLIVVSTSSPGAVLGSGSVLRAAEMYSPGMTDRRFAGCAGVLDIQPG